MILPDEEIEIGGVTLESPGRTELELRLARLPSGAWMSVPVMAIRGAKPGPSLWLAAAVHGDEVVGVEIIRQVLARLDPASLAGMVLAVPVVNVHGFATGDRYLPDRRDLNRSFPGSRNGSLASRLAWLFMSEIVDRCDFGIDLHTGSDRRSNLPQIRADLNDPETLELARTFAPPVMLHSGLRDGSLRAAATKQGKRVLLYEGGEALRFDEEAIDRGRDGVFRVMDSLGMTDVKLGKAESEPAVSYASKWVRTPRSGLLRSECRLGDRVSSGEQLGFIAEVDGTTRPIRASTDGVVIGRNEDAVVNRGDAAFHIAQLQSD